VHDFIYQGVLSVLQQQLNAPLAEEHEAEPLRPTVPENRVAAGGNHFAQPAAAREPAAPRYSSEAPRPSSGAAAAGAASWPHAQPGYQKQQGRSIASCWKHRRWNAKAARRRLQRTGYPGTAKALAAY
jgi:DNA mismatch repair protein MutL